MRQETNKYHESIPQLQAATQEATEEHVQTHKKVQRRWITTTKRAIDHK